MEKIKSIKPVFRKVRGFSRHILRRSLRHPVWSALAGALLVAAVATAAILSYLPRGDYNMGIARNLLTQPNMTVAKSIKYDDKKKAYTFDTAVQDTAQTKTTSGIGGVMVTAADNPLTGVTVTDSTNGYSLSMAPRYGSYGAKRTDDRIVYPMKDNSGWTVYTISKSGIKEDIVLRKSTTDSRTFSFALGLGPNLTARIEPDGGIGVYGNSLLANNVSAATVADSALLQKARANAPKDTLLFRIPKPILYEQNGKQSKATAVYSLEGDTLNVIANGLSHASYPLTVDPSIYVVTAQQFMNGNNETNINYDIANKLIDKTPTTGARFNTWNQTTALPSSAYNGGSVAAGGFVYNLGGVSFNGQVLNTQGSSSITIPSGVTSISVKSWGGGGGSGGSSTSANGGVGGGGGFVQATFTVTPGETLTTYVGGGGNGGTLNSAGGGGGGGGYTSIYRGSTPLLIAPGGGGGGGANGTSAGGAAGAGGGGGGNGSSSGNAGGGNPASGSGGGTGGSGGNNAGADGSSLNGGAGGDGRTATGADGSGATGGQQGGGNGGSIVSTSRAGGGGGGGGYYGGGGGSGSANNSGGGGGGGGYYYYDPSASSTNVYTGNKDTPGGSGDSNRANAGTGAPASSLGSTGNTGSSGLLYIAYGSGGYTVSSALSWAQFNQSNSTISSADPGSGSCSGWCTTSAYNLPAPRKNFAFVTYNGFLYAMGGQDQSSNDQQTVYVAKLGANGEPQLWHPTSSDKSTWTYWYKDANLTTTQTVFSAVAYNNRMYIVGGKNGGNYNSSVYYANINPNGTLGGFTTTTSLPRSLGDGDVQVYNDRIYYIGGHTYGGDTPLASVYYAKIANDGTVGSWSATSSMSSGKTTGGGSFSAIWGAYIYVSGGCLAVNGNGYCTSVASDTQLASINADGSLDAWSTNGGVSNTVMGGTLLPWRNTLYYIGGCTNQDTSGGACNTISNTIQYGVINTAGDASTVAQSTANGSGTCTGGSASNCNLPGTNYVGNMLSAAIIANGYLYVIGGCTTNACDATSGNVAYTSITAAGTTSRPATCPNGSYQGGQWCVDTTNTVSGGIAASSPVFFNNRIYLVGGLNGNNNTNTIVRTTLNSDGSIGAWTSQSMTGVGAANVSYLYSYARANPSSAGTNPGNLYVFGGCTTSSAAGCTAYSQAVSKCNIATGGAISGCSTSGQLQIGTIPGDTAAGLGIMSGTVYANYVYLIGGVSPNKVDLPTVRYAKIDSNNNIVAASGSTWIESPNQMAIGRRRAAAFGYNGFLYAVGGYDGTSSSVLADIEFIKINVSDGSLGTTGQGFQVSSVQINQRWGLSVPVSNSFAYVIGGCVAGASPSGCTSRTDVVQTFQIYNNNDGAPAGYSNANSIQTSPNRYGHSATVLNGYMYAAGGCITTDCTGTTNDVSYAPINSDGSLGSWSTANSILPAVRAWGSLESVGGSLYYVGGQSNTTTDYRTEVYYVTPSTNGNITNTWATASNGLPAGRSQFGATIWNNRLYVLGGKAATSSCSSGVCNSIYVSPQLSNGGDISGAWSSSSTPFTIARSGLTAVAYANNLYILGGYDGTNVLSDTQYAQINGSNGSAGSWTYSESLPNPIMNGDGFAANGYIYLIGGRSTATTCTPNSYVAPISANTTIASGNKPTGVGAWFSTNTRYSGDRYGNTATYANGKAYVMGGICNGNYPSSSGQQTTLLSQPQVAKYSIAFDTDTEVTPNYWLINGLDNSIGASWQLKYRSMTNNSSTSCTSPAMTTWGQETNFGNITLGLPGVYTPKNASGANTNCARYYYMNLTVDSSQAFGYPDDVSRGPTISDITLQFTADPSKRLMHGRTYTGGLQQPIDTPYYTQ